MHSSCPPANDEPAAAVLYVLDVRSTASDEWVRAWKPAVAGISEVFHARFVRHAYPRHTHEDWTLFIVDDGGIRYDLDKRARGVGPALVTVLPPQVVHDGRPASHHGFHKRVLYVDTDVLGLHLAGRAADEPDIHDRSLLRTLRHLHDVLGDADELLEAESVMGIVQERLRLHLRDDVAPDRPQRDEVIASALRDLLEAHLPDRLTLAEAADTLGTSTAGLVRAFTRTFGIAPHQYVIGRRVELARRRLLAGEPPASTAVGVGFHDQAHLTRHFRRHVGATPGRFATSGIRLKGDWR
jgi:AraC-like DNA-binding protein